MAITWKEITPPFAYDNFSDLELRKTQQSRGTADLRVKSIAEKYPARPAEMPSIASTMERNVIETLHKNIVEMLATDHELIKIFHERFLRQELLRRYEKTTENQQRTERFFDEMWQNLRETRLQQRFERVLYNDKIRRLLLNKQFENTLKDQYDYESFIKDRNELAHDHRTADAKQVSDQRDQTLERFENQAAATQQRTEDFKAATMKFLKIRPQQISSQHQAILQKSSEEDKKTALAAQEAFIERLIWQREHQEKIDGRELLLNLAAFELTMRLYAIQTPPKVSGEANLINPAEASVRDLPPKVLFGLIQKHLNRRS
jgi:hypothetical protein